MDINFGSIKSIEPYNDSLRDGYDTQYSNIGVRGCVGSTDYPYIWQGGEYKRYVNYDDWIAIDNDGNKYIIPIGVIKLFGFDKLYETTIELKEGIDAL